MHEWVQKLESLTRVVKKAHAVTFIIGAGGSLSSGGPLTERVISELLEYKFFRTADELRSKLHELSDRIKSSAIVPLFNRFTPYLGYRALAALSHHKRVLVLNLNWDLGVEEACKAVGIPYESVDINDQKKLKAALENPEARLICVHLHGSLESGELRLGRLETLTFKRWQKDLLLHEFLVHPTVIVGATLRGDTDMVDLLLDIERRKNLKPDPVWVLTRDTSVYEDAALRRMLAARRSVPNMVYDPNLDFDRALIWINSQLCGFTFKDFVAVNDGSFDVHEYGEIVLPKPDVLRPHLDKHTIVLQGEARLGKTTLAHFLAFFFHTLRPSPGKIDPLTKTCVRPFSASAPRSCANTLGNAKPDDVIVLEDPFGATTRFEPNPEFLRALRGRALHGKKHREGRTIVTSRESTWNAGVEKAQPRRQRELFDETSDSAIISDADDWYDAEDLRQLVPPNRTDLLQRIVPGDLNTPARVLDAVNEESFTAVRQHEVVQDKIETFRRFGLNVQRVVALLRLQQMSSHPRTWNRILEDAGVIDAERLTARLSAYVRMFDLDATFARLRHPTDVEAVDQLLSAENSELLADIRTVAPYVRWVENALRIRDAMRAFEATQEDEPLAELSPDEVAEWAPTLLVAAQRPEAIRGLDGKRKKMDAWALRDYVYEIVRLWKSLRTSRAARTYLRRILRDRRRQGVYAVLEAALYLRWLTHAEIWARLENELWNLAEAPEQNRENVALVFDAMFWRDAPDQRLRTSEWVDRLLRHTERTDPIRGAFAFSLVFHANAAPTYLGGERAATQHTLEILNTLEKGPQTEMFCWMLRWHYMHTARDRALVQRRDQIPNEFLAYLRRTTFEREASEDDRRILIAACERLNDLGQPGAAFLLAMNVSAIRGEFDIAPLLRRLLAHAEPSDPYVVLAMMTYSSVLGDAVDDARAFFNRPESREALLEAFARGVTLDGITVEWPRFDACRDAFKVMETLHIRWPELEQLDPRLRERTVFVGWLKAWQQRVSAEAGDFRRLVKLLGRGDLRPLAMAVAEMPQMKAEEREKWSARVIERAVQIVRDRAVADGQLVETASLAPMVDLAWYRDQLRDTSSAGHRLKMESAITEILSLPSHTPEQQRLRAETLQLQARNALLDDRPNPMLALKSAREARQLLLANGQEVPHDEEQVHKTALLNVAFPQISTVERLKLLRQPVEVLERTSELVREKKVSLPTYAWNAAARKALQRVIALAQREARESSAKRRETPAPPSHAAAEPSPPDQTVADASHIDIEKLAGKYLAGVTSPPTSLETLYPRLKIKAVQEVAAIADSGGLRHEDDGWRIVYATGESSARVNFTKAHEVAHAIVKEEMPRLRVKKDELERICNSLAASLLMPKEAFRSSLGTPVTLASLRNAAELYKVSLQAAAIRCEELTGCPAFHVEEGRVEWTTRNVPPRLPMLRDIVRSIFAGRRDIDPIFLSTRRYSGFWSVEFDKSSEQACTVFLRPLPLGHTTDRPPLFA